MNIINSVTIGIKNQNGDIDIKTYHSIPYFYGHIIIDEKNFTDGVIAINGQRKYFNDFKLFYKTIQKLSRVINKYMVSSYTDITVIIDELNIKPLFNAINKLGFKLEIPTFNSIGDKLRLTKKVKNFFGEKIFNIIGHSYFRIVKIENMINDILISYILTGVNDNKTNVLSLYIKKEF